MTARDELIKQLKDADTFCTDAGAGRLIDAYAHELAEKIRHYGQTGLNEEDGMDLAADLIDPEVR